MILARGDVQSEGSHCPFRKLTKFQRLANLGIEFLYYDYEKVEKIFEFEFTSSTMATYQNGSLSNL